jgi:hypothetical protein
VADGGVLVVVVVVVSGGGGVYLTVTLTPSVLDAFQIKSSY